MKKILLVLPILNLMISISSYSQNIINNAPPVKSWVELMQDPEVNFYDVQKAFEAYWKNKPVVKGQGYKQFKRWENYMAPRVYPSGERKGPATTYQNYQDYLSSNAFNKKASASSLQSNPWTYIGPTNTTVEDMAGRINFIRFQPGDNKVIYIGSASGGVWKSGNGGDLWLPITNNLATLCMSDLAIDPVNIKVMYLATGDADDGSGGGVQNSFGTIGILKTTDGGLTWNTTGLSYQLANIYSLAGCL